MGRIETHFIKIKNYMLLSTKTLCKMCNLQSFNNTCLLFDGVVLLQTKGGKNKRCKECLKAEVKK